VSRFFCLFSSERRLIEAEKTAISERRASYEGDRHPREARSRVSRNERWKLEATGRRNWHSHLHRRWSVQILLVMLWDVCSVFNAEQSHKKHWQAFCPIPTYSIIFNSHTLYVECARGLPKLSSSREELDLSLGQLSLEKYSLDSWLRTIQRNIEFIVSVGCPRLKSSLLLLELSSGRLLAHSKQVFKHVLNLQTEEYNQNRRN
jgi:hypothetical protein